jgi:transcription elongation factor GreA
MADKPVPLTKDGMAKLQQELEHLRTVRRHDVAEQLHRTKEAATTQYDAEYEDAKNEQAFVEGRILTIENMLRNATIIDEDSAHHTARIQLGSHVRVKTDKGSEQAFVIVGPAEADPGSGRISNESPVGRALLGRQVGEDVEVLAPSGSVKLKVQAVD